jgi:lipoprotein LprG
VAVKAGTEVKTAAATLLLAIALVTTSCGTTLSNPAALLASAQAKTNHTPALHFHISSDQKPIASGPPFLLSADGDVLRPDGFSGSLEISASGVIVPVNLVAAGGHFWVRLPFSTSWTMANPHDYGFNDPSLLLDTKKGVSVLLNSPQQVRQLGNDRLQGEELNEISFTVPGSQIETIFPGGAAQAQDQITAGISVSSGEVRRLVITGPIVSAGETSTFTIVLSQYGESVQITPPG